MRTNPGLTTNIKIVVDSSYGLSMDSINSLPELSFSKYKKVSFKKEDYYDEIVPYFYGDLPAEIAFGIKYDDDSDSMTDDFADQYDEIYQYGAKNIVQNKDYGEEFEYFAPLYVHQGSLPTHFAIFRVDGTGIDNIDKNNFKQKILSKFKTVKIFDLTKSTPIGEWLYKNIDDNEFFPLSPFEMSYSNTEFSQWNGIDFKSGGYVSKSYFMEDVLEEEKEIFEMEKFIFDGYRTNKVVFPNILNLSFLFDDQPADENSLKKWSINRYYGFYLNEMHLKKTISPYIPPAIKNGATIADGNVLSHPEGQPFENGWSDDLTFYVEIGGSYYKVEKFTVRLKDSVKASNSLAHDPKGRIGAPAIMSDIGDPSTSQYKKDEITPTYEDRWRIISDLDLKGKESLMNKNIGFIDGTKTLVDGDGEPIDIDGFDAGDLWVIEIDGMYHNLVRDSSGSIRINSDYSFSFPENAYEYYVNSIDPSYRKRVSLFVDGTSSPKKFSIYKASFSDIKDFDNRIVDTEPSKFEYDVVDEVVRTDETKLYMTNLNSTTNPKELDDFYYKDKLANIPVSSEYTANHETFKIDGGNLSSIWRKNPVYCRWGFAGSLSANDYPYLINNSSRFEKNNRTTNTFEAMPSRRDRNLDYFYTINSDSSRYSHHTLHIERIKGGIPDPDFDFSFEKYMGKKRYIQDGEEKEISVDYFESIFRMKAVFESGTVIKQTKKYSEFSRGDSVYPNISLFRGIKFSIYDVEKKGLKLNSSGRIEVINTKTNNSFDGYKMSILLTSSDNGMKWRIIERWSMDKEYDEGQVVSHDDILYVAKKKTICQDPGIYLSNDASDQSTVVKSAPYNQLSYKTVIEGLILSMDHNNLNPIINRDYNPSGNNDWELFDAKGILWNPLKALRSGGDVYKVGDYVYNTGNYYIYQTITTPTKIDFWNPLKSHMRLQSDPTPKRSGYYKSEIVIYRGRYYSSLDDYNFSAPDDSARWAEVPANLNSSKWIPVEMWVPNKRYETKGEYVVFDDVLYVNDSILPIPSGEMPNISLSWKRIYSMSPDTDFVYDIDSNPIHIQNGEYYQILGNPMEKTLENGIRIIINKIHKNILFNIFVNDNTLGKLRDARRDDMYRSLYAKLTAKNFVDAVNDLTNKKGFSDYLSYVVIEEDGKTSEYKYGQNIESLPYLILAERPEPVNVKVNSLYYLPSNQVKLKPTKILTDGKISNLSQLNYFNGTHMGSEIIQNNDTPLVIPNFGSIASVSSNRIYRFSGGYMPVFYEIPLFRSDNYIEYKKMDIAIEVGETQNVTFDYLINGTATQSTHLIYPGASFSNAQGYFSQISEAIRTDLPFVKMIYEVSSVKKIDNSPRILCFDISNYSERKKEWLDTSVSDKVSFISSAITRSDIYPGDHLVLSGSHNPRSYTKTEKQVSKKSDMTFEALVWSEDVGAITSFMGDTSVYFGISSSRAFAYVDGRYLYSSNILNNRTWYHIAFTIGQGSAKVYINAIDRTDTSFSGTNILYTGVPTSNSSPFNIGYHSENPVQGISPLSGRISDVRVHDRLLSESEIMAAYSSRHKRLIARYPSGSIDIRLELQQQRPLLTMDIIDLLDPLDPNYTLVVGATGGNPPYTFSVKIGNGAASEFDEEDQYSPIPKSSEVLVVAKDKIGLTSSTGYYRINGNGQEKFAVNGKFSY